MTDDGKKEEKLMSEFKAKTTGELLDQLGESDDEIVRYLIGKELGVREPFSKYLELIAVLDGSIATLEQRLAGHVHGPDGKVCLPYVIEK